MNEGIHSGICVMVAKTSSLFSPNAIFKSYVVSIKKLSGVNVLHSFLQHVTVIWRRPILHTDMTRHRINSYTIVDSCSCRNLHNKTPCYSGMKFSRISKKHFLLFLSSSGGTAGSFLYQCPPGSLGLASSS